MSDLVKRLRSPIISFEDNSSRRYQALATEAAAEIDRLTAELAEAMAEVMEQARCNGMGAERELKLIAERDALRAELAEARAEQSDAERDEYDVRKERDALRALLRTSRPSDSHLTQANAHDPHRRRPARDRLRRADARHRPARVRGQEAQGDLVIDLTGRKYAAPLTAEDVMVWQRLKWRGCRGEWLPWNALTSDKRDADEMLALVADTMETRNAHAD